VSPKGRPEGEQAAPREARRGSRFALAQRTLAFDALRYAGLAALGIYTLGVVNEHSTALRQIGFYVSIVVALALALWQPRQVAKLAHEPLGWWLIAVALFGVVATLVSPAPAYSGWEAYKELGFLVLSAYATAMIVRGAQDADLLMWAAVAAAIDVSIYAIAQYVGELWRATTWPVPDIQRHRYYAEPLLWFLPALLWALKRTRERYLPWAGAGLAVYLLLLAATGARAAWYGGILAAAVWFYADANRTRLVVVTAALVAAVALALWMVPPSIFLEQALRGVWASHRVHGTWLPAAHLISERPWLGYGYGEALFHIAYDAEVASHPDWYFRHSLGPHNVFLALWFAGGVGLVASVAGLLVTYFRFAARVVADGTSPWRGALLAGACSVLGYLVIRGMFEAIPFRVCGLAFGVALACALARGAPSVVRVERLAPSGMHVRP
jgi:O-antigen ligase